MEAFRRWRAQPRERLAERVSAATYGTVLVLAALSLLTTSDVGSGVGWGLVTGVGLATYVAHGYAEVVGDHLRHGSPLDRAEVVRALRDGLPILAAPVLPALVLGLGTVEVIGDGPALWLSLAVAISQLIALGVLVGLTVRTGRYERWSYGLVAAAVGMLVVLIKVALSH